jgi:tRNA dimethylallyltransferase
MFAHGLVDEVRRLRGLPQTWSREASQALGYKEVAEHLAGAVSLDEAIAQVKTRSRQFAKRQLTWFRSLPELRPVRSELTSVLDAFRMD